MPETKITSTNSIGPSAVDTDAIIDDKVTSSKLATDISPPSAISAPQLSSTLDLSGKTVTFSAPQISPHAPASQVETNVFNIGLLGFKMAVNEGLTVFNLIDGVVDEFNDETGIDTPENSNAVYDSSSDFYSNQSLGPVPSPQVQRTSITSTGPSTYNVEPTIQTVNVLVVGGGGAGGGAGPGPANAFGGGGGAGGLIYYPAYPVTPGGSISVTVGTGGAGAENEYGAKGTDSSFGPLIGEGGGGGYDYASPYPDFTVFDSRVNGGSGGGVGNHPSFYNRPGEETQTNNHPIPITPSGINSADQSPNVDLAGSYGNDGGVASTYQGPTPGGSGEPGGGSGGGGAGEVGGDHPHPPASYSLGGEGGDGLQYTTADGSTPIGYAGGGEAGGYNTDAARRAGVTVTPQTFGAGLAGQEGTSSPQYDPWPQKSYFHAIETPNKFDGMDAIANRGSGGGGAHNHGIQSAGTGFGGNGGSGIVIVAENTFLVTNTSMTLISDTFTANSTPTKARIVVFAEVPDDLNTDFTASVTRDNSTFNAITLTDEGFETGSSGTKIFTGSTPLTGSASPQVALRWKIVGSSLTSANKIHGVALQWA